MLMFQSVHCTLPLQHDVKHLTLLLDNLNYLRDKMNVEM